MFNSDFNNEELLNRVCEVYGFSQKVQLANHFNMAASSLQNRYTRGNLSYDLAVHCALETGTDIRWLMTGEGNKNTQQVKNTSSRLKLFTLSEGLMLDIGFLSIDEQLFEKPKKNAMCIKHEKSSYIVERDSLLADGQWVVDIEGAISIRDLTVLPGKKLHVAGGKIPFECEIEQIKTIGRIVGVYSEVN